MSTRKKAILALIFANIIWGAASPIFKWSLQNIGPFTLAFLRFSLASLLIFPFCIHKLTFKLKDLPNIFLVSFFGITLNISFFFLGLERAPAINAPMIASSGPIFLILTSILFLKEKPKKKIIKGTIISLLGVILIILEPLLETGLDGSVLGNLFFLIATFGAVGHAITSKKLLDKYQAITVTFWSFIIGSLTFLPFFLNEAKNPCFLANLGFQGFIGIIFGAILSSALAYFLYEWGMQKIQACEVGIFTYIDPVVAILVAMPLLHEMVTPVYILGSLLVFTGIFISEGRIHYHPFHHLFKKT